MHAQGTGEVTWEVAHGCKHGRSFHGVGCSVGGVHEIVRAGFPPEAWLMPGAATHPSHSRVHVAERPTSDMFPSALHRSIRLNQFPLKMHPRACRAAAGSDWATAAQLAASWRYDRAASLGKTDAPPPRLLHLSTSQSGPHRYVWAVLRPERGSGDGTSGGGAPDVLACWHINGGCGTAHGVWYAHCALWACSISCKRAGGSGAVPLKPCFHSL